MDSHHFRVEEEAKGLFLIFVVIDGNVLNKKIYVYKMNVRSKPSKEKQQQRDANDDDSAFDGAIGRYVDTVCIQYC